MVTERRAERAEDARDLRRQITGLERGDEQEIVFRENSPQRRKLTLYSMTDGEPIEIPAYMLNNVLAKVQENGEPRFTARKDRAPQYQQGKVKCFLHTESPERFLLDEIGLGNITCPAGKLANQHSRRMHALHRHKEEWAALQEYVAEQKEKDALERQEKQLDATLSLARQAAAPVAVAEVTPRIQVFESKPKKRGRPRKRGRHATED